ncbi:7609_t:CDS:2 [Paraglomus brasilianum]|uniref:7609_t:CDS:1 n=1 Tax=Paraglomus brasilianum TaxID=144538 RepID=A0A9N9A1H8_9GLOM|nr:7609_t:CDS:2 [Paraglomus brasilianum]
MEDYDVFKELGDGSFGTVIQAKHKHTGQMVAIKTMKKKFSSWDKACELREFKARRKSAIDAETNERLIHYWDDGEGVCKEEKGNDNWKEDKRNCAVDDVDVGADDENVEYIVKVGDFGLTREIKSRPPYTEYVSTRWYRAPEVLLRSPSYSSPVDLWAVGVIMAEVCTLKPLFPGQSEIDQMFRICEVLGSPTPGDDAVGQIGGMGGGDWKEGVKLAKSKGFCFPAIPPQNIAKRLPRSTPPTFIQLLSHLLRYNPRQRLTALDALLHPYFAEANLHFIPTEITDEVKLSKVGQERKRKMDGFYGFRKLGYGTENKKGVKYSWCKGEELGEREGKEHLDKDVVLIPSARSLPSYSPLSAMENNRSCLLSLNIDAAHDVNLGDYVLPSIETISPFTGGSNLSSYPFPSKHTNDESNTGSESERLSNTRSGSLFPPSPLSPLSSSAPHPFYIGQKMYKSSKAYETVASNSNEKTSEKANEKSFPHTRQRSYTASSIEQFKDLPAIPALSTFASQPTTSPSYLHANHHSQSSPNQSSLYSSTNHQSTAILPTSPGPPSTTESSFSNKSTLSPTNFDIRRYHLPEDVIRFFTQEDASSRPRMSVRKPSRDFMRTHRRYSSASAATNEIILEEGDLCEIKFGNNRQTRNSDNKTDEIRKSHGTVEKDGNVTTEAHSRNDSGYSISESFVYVNPAEELADIQTEHAAKFEKEKWWKLDRKKEQKRDSQSVDTNKPTAPSNGALTSEFGSVHYGKHLKTWRHVKDGKEDRKSGINTEKEDRSWVGSVGEALESAFDGNFSSLNPFSTRRNAQTPPSTSSHPSNKPPSLSMQHLSYMPSPDPSPTRRTRRFSGKQTSPTTASPTTSSPAIPITGTTTKARPSFSQNEPLETASIFTNLNGIIGSIKSLGSDSSFASGNGNGLRGEFWTLAEVPEDESDDEFEIDEIYSSSTAKKPATALDSWISKPSTHQSNHTSNGFKKSRTRSGGQGLFGAWSKSASGNNRGLARSSSVGSKRTGKGSGNNEKLSTSASQFV